MDFCISSLVLPLWSAPSFNSLMLDQNSSKDSAMERLFYQNAPAVTIATNTFINVPIVLQHDDTPLISVVRDYALGYTTEIPIFHPDGTYLAKVNGTRIFSTEAGKKVGLEVTALPQLTVCKMGNRVLFEIHHEKGDAFRTAAELYTPNGQFVRCTDDAAAQLMNSNGQSIKLGGVTMSRCIFEGMRIGLLLSSNGSVSVGVN